MPSRRIRTVLYGDQQIDAAELDLLHTPLMQRLYDLHQLGLTDRVYIDASHSRLHHVIGVLQQVENLIRAIARNLEKPGREPLAFRGRTGHEEFVDAKQFAQDVLARRSSARLMGFLHDITHAPYGHTLEDEIQLQTTKHDDPERQAANFYRLVCQYIVWIALEDSPENRLLHDDPEIQKVFKELVHSPNTCDLPESDAFIEAIAQLGGHFLIEDRLYRRMLRAPGPRLMESFLRDLRFAMRALLWLDAFPKDDFWDLLKPAHQRKIKPDGSYPFEQLLDRILAAAGKPSLLAHEQFHVQRDGFLLDIIGNTICADLLDYAKRDSVFSGLRLDYDVDRIVENFTLISYQRRRDCKPHQQRALHAKVDPIIRTAISLFSHKIRLDVPGELMNLLNVRFYVYQRVLFHPTKCIAGAMLGSALNLLGWKTLPRHLQYLGDAVFLYELKEVASLARGLIKDYDNQATVQSKLPLIKRRLLKVPETGISIATRELLESREQDQIASVAIDLEAALLLLARLAARRYHRVVFRLLPNANMPSLNMKARDIAEYFVDPNIRGAAERQIEELCSLPRGSVTIHCPPGEGPKKIAEILVAGKQGTEDIVAPLRDIEVIDRDIFEKHSVAIRALEDMYSSMWRLQVSVAPPLHVEYERINPTIGRVLFSVLRGLPYEQVYRHQSEEELNASIGSLRSVPNDTRMEDELKYSVELEEEDRLGRVRILHDDGRYEDRTETFMHVADLAIARLEEASPRVRSYLRQDPLAAKGRKRSVKEAVEEAIPIAALVPPFPPGEKPEESLEQLDILPTTHSPGSDADPRDSDKS